MPKIEKQVFFLSFTPWTTILFPFLLLLHSSQEYETMYSSKSVIRL